MKAKFRDATLDNVDGALACAAGHKTTHTQAAVVKADTNTPQRGDGRRRARQVCGAASDTYPRATLSDTAWTQVSEHIGRPKSAVYRCSFDIAAVGALLCAMIYGRKRVSGVTIRRHTIHSLGVSRYLRAVGAPIRSSNLLQHRLADTSFPTAARASNRPIAHVEREM